MIFSISSISASDDNSLSDLLLEESSNGSDISDDSLNDLNGSSNGSDISDDSLNDLNGSSNGSDNSEDSSTINEDENSNPIDDFDDLIIKINETPQGGLLVLDKDYKFTNSSLNFSNRGILISKSITIDGNGHTINANKVSRVFNITADNVILKNINFINGNALGRYDNIDVGGGALHWYGNNGKLINCNFTNNTGCGIEDDPYDKEYEEIIMEDGTVSIIYRQRPMGARTNEGGAIVWRGNNGKIYNCIFNNNDIGYPNMGGAVVWRGDNGSIMDSTFYQNGAWCGGAISWIGNNGKIISSNFFDNGIFNGDIYWFGENGTIKKSILLKENKAMSAVISAYGGTLNANGNFWGDTLVDPNGTIKVKNISNWYFLDVNTTNVTLFDGDKLLVDFDDFLLVTKNGNIYNGSDKIGKINLDPKEKLMSKNLVKYYKSSSQFNVKVYDPYGKLALNKYITIKINNKSFKVKTNKKGIASLKINQKPGTYNVLVQYGKAKAKNKITVKSVLLSKNITKKFNRSEYFFVKTLNVKGKPYAKQVINVEFRGKTYKLKTNNKGIARFALPKQLKKGNYSIKTTYKGLTNLNKITVK